MASCWLCKSPLSYLLRNGVSPGALASENFAITDAHYGATLDIHRCGDCGFLFCPDAGDVTGYYAELEDAEYVRTQDQRKLQAQKLIELIQFYKPRGALLDIGAASGILVGCALQAGYNALGVEPSRWLADQARQANAPVIEGIFPAAIAAARFDIITLVDVLEHVHDPAQLLADMTAHLNPDGIAVVVTPDVKSLAARILGRRWWHYRIAHISYFEKRTLQAALERAGLEPIIWQRPAWYFPLDYLLLRLAHYLPGTQRAAAWGWTKKLTVPLNLRDSWLVVARKTAG